MFVVDLLRDAVIQYSERNAVVVVGRDEMIYVQWEAGSNRIVQYLFDSGFELGDRVALLFDNVDAVIYLSIYVGIHKVGGVSVFCNIWFMLGELAHVFDHLGARMVVYGSEYAGVVVEVSSEFDRVFDASIIRVIVSVGPNMFVRVERVGDDLADILYILGITGTLKGVVCIYDNISFSGSFILS